MVTDSVLETEVPKAHWSACMKILFGGYGGGERGCMEVGAHRACSVLQVLYSRTMPLFTVIYTELQACSDPLIHYNVPTFLFALHTG